jgi:ketosteroid isomerase-like protein
MANLRSRRAEPAEPQTSEYSAFSPGIWLARRMTGDDAAPWLALDGFRARVSSAYILELPSCASARELLMPNDASARGEPTRLAERVRLALESGDLDAIRDLLEPDARWGAPAGPHAADCKNRDQVIAWWGSARAAGARAVVREVTAGAGTLLVGLEVTGTPTAREAGGAAERWQVLTLRDGRIVDIRGFADRAAAAGHAGVPA